jgi:hypothetical protein
MRNEMAGRAARRLLARMKRMEKMEAYDEARDEAQRLLLARHLARLNKGSTSDNRELAGITDNFTDNLLDRLR